MKIFSRDGEEYVPERPRPVDNSLPPLPTGFYFHVGPRDAWAQYGGGKTFGVQIREHIGPFWHVWQSRRCESHPEDIAKYARLLAEALINTLHQDRIEQALSGSYKPGKRDLPPTPAWNELTVRSRKAIER